MIADSLSALIAAALVWEPFAGAEEARFALAENFAAAQCVRHFDGLAREGREYRAES